MHEKVKSLLFPSHPANESTDIKNINVIQLPIVIYGVQKILSVCIAFGHHANNGHIRKLFCVMNKVGKRLQVGKQGVLQVSANVGLVLQNKPMMAVGVGHTELLHNSMGII